MKRFDSSSRRDRNRVHMHAARTYGKLRNWVGQKLKLIRLFFAAMTATAKATHEILPIMRQPERLSRLRGQIYIVPLNLFLLLYFLLNFSCNNSFFKFLLQ